MNTIYNNKLFNSNYLHPTNNSMKKLIEKYNEERTNFTCYNKKIHDYCLQTTNDSITKIIKKHNEKKKMKTDCFDLQIKNKEYDFKPTDAFFPFILFLSASSFYLYFMSKKNK